MVVRGGLPLSFLVVLLSAAPPPNLKAAEDAAACDLTEGFDTTNCSTPRRLDDGDLPKPPEATSLVLDQIAQQTRQKEMAAEKEKQQVANLVEKQDAASDQQEREAVEAIEDRTGSDVPEKISVANDSQMAATEEEQAPPIDTGALLPSDQVLAPPPVATDAKERGMDGLYGSFEYIHPMPNAKFVSPLTSIAVRHGATLLQDSYTAGQIRVVGKQSGQQMGELVLGDDAKTLLFYPNGKLTPGEWVDVTVKPGIRPKYGKATAAFSWGFQVSPKAIKTYRFSKRGGYEMVTSKQQEQQETKNVRPLVARPSADDASDDSGDSERERAAFAEHNSMFAHTFAAMKHDDRPIVGDMVTMGQGQENEWEVMTKDYITIPSDFPHVRANNRAARQGRQDALGEGYIFASNIRWPEDTYVGFLTIFDDNGDIIWYHALNKTSDWSLIDFRKQRNGLLTYHDTRKQAYVEIDHHYRSSRVLHPGHGYWANGHGMQIREDGSQLFIIYAEEKMDVTMISKKRERSQVVGQVVQEIDPSGNVLWEWRSWDHLPSSFTETRAVDQLDKGYCDHIHLNSVDWTPDGHILMSLRHLEQILKVSRWTGETMWRLGGDANEWTFTNEDRPFSHQHDARILDNGHLTIFDNGNLAEPQYSRAVEYELDQVNKVATKVWEHRSSPDRFGMATGGLQRLPNGNSVICWGGVGRPEKLPFMSEVTEDGEVMMELEFVAKENSYRASRAAWWGRSEEPPVLMLNTKETLKHPQLHFSWNGVTNIESWNVYGSETRLSLPQSKELLQLITSINKTRFEESFPLVDGLPQLPCYYYVVEALNNGTSLAFSDLMFVGQQPEQCQ